MKGLALFSLLVSLAACSEGSKDTPASTASAKEGDKTTATATATAEAAPAPRKLEPYPLTLELPASATIDAAPGSGVMIKDGSVSLVVTLLEGDLAKEKKSLETLPLFDFQKWLKEDKDLAVAEFTGPDYRAILVVEVGGKKYTCKNVGMLAAPSAEEAEAIVMRCRGLKSG